MSLPLLVLPPIVWLLLALLRPVEIGLAPVIARAALLTGGIVFLLTEGLSLVEALRPVPVTLAWFAVISVLAVLAFSRRGTGRFDPKWWRRQLAQWRESHSGERDHSITLMITVMVIVVGVTGLIAVASPPNNWDSLTYHLPRVMHWAVNGDVNHYPTAIDPQLYNGPFKEYLLLHLYLLTGSLGLFNLAQWCALILAGLASYLIADELGATPRGRVAAAFITIVAPMAILQATSTQSDLTEAAGLLLLVHAALVSRRRGLTDRTAAAYVGLALGLVVLTKSTGFIFAAPVMLLWLTGHRPPLRRALASIGVVAAVFAVINGPGFARNVTSWGSPLGPPSSNDMVNDHFGVGLTVLNATRLAASDLTTPWDGPNQQITTWVNDFGAMLGEAPTDRGSLLSGDPFRLLWRTHEDIGSSPLHVLLIATVLIAGTISYRRWRGLPIAYAAAILTGFVIFAAYLRWQLWGNRLDLPLLLMWAPLTGLLWGTWRKRAIIPLCIGITACSGPFLLNNVSRPLIGPDSILTTSRQTTLFRNNAPLHKPYLHAVRSIAPRHPTDIGLVMGADYAWEYPLWALTKGPLHGPHFSAVLPDRPPATGQPAYQALICVETPTADCAALAPSDWITTPFGRGVSVALPPE